MKKSLVLLILFLLLVIVTIIPVKTDALIIHMSGVEVGDPVTMTTGCYCPKVHSNCGCAIVF